GAPLPQSGDGVLGLDGGGTAACTDRGGRAVDLPDRGHAGGDAAWSAAAQPGRQPGLDGPLSDGLALAGDRAPTARAAAGAAGPESEDHRLPAADGRLRSACRNWPTAIAQMSQAPGSWPCWRA